MKLVSYYGGAIVIGFMTHTIHFGYTIGASLLWCLLIGCIYDASERYQ